MIRWCSYCQRYLGESAPFDRFEISHGICKPCLGAKAMYEPNAVDRVKPVAAYYRRVASAMFRSENPQALLEEGLQIGLDPWDLLIGIIQPALQSMGDLWAKSQAEVSEEHHLTATCTEILLLMEAQQPEFQTLSRSPAPEVVLVNAEGNRHELGTRLLEFYLATRSVPVMAVHQGLPTEEVVRLVRALKPRRLGISCALPEQLASVRRTAEALAALPAGERPLVLAGGFGVRGQAGETGDGLFRISTAPGDLVEPAAADWSSPPDSGA